MQLHFEWIVTPLDGGAWLGEHWRGLNKMEELSEVMQVAFDAIAKKNLIPMNSAADIATVPSDLFAKFQLSFYSSPEDAVIKSLGIE